MRFGAGQLAAAVFAISVAACAKTTPVEPTPPVVQTTTPTVLPPATANRPPTATIVDVQPPGIALAAGTRVSFGGRGADLDGDSLTSSFTGSVGDPRAVSLSYQPGSGSCVPPESYDGEADEGVNRITFAGTGCRKLTLIRQ